MEQPNQSYINSLSGGDDAFKQKLIDIIKKEYPEEKQVYFDNFKANNFKLAVKLGLDGVYLPSFNKKQNHQIYMRRKNFLILGSAHNIKEIKEKERQQVDIIFISSLFKNKKTFLGLNKFNILSKHTKAKIVALGGINKENFTKLKLLNIFGFAGISFFDVKKNGP